jgi:peptidyl-prolyl cis-trans isomerase D
MASQITKPATGQPPKGPSSEQPKKGSKNPLIYAGTIVLLVIVVIAFVFVPAGGGAFGSRGGNLEFGRYDGKSISYAQNTYFATQVKQLNDSLRQSGISQDNYQFYAYQVWRGAFERTVVRTAILDSVKKAGGYVTEAKLDEKITELPSFQENGKFSVQRYRSASLSEKLSARDELRDDTLTELYYGDVVEASTPSSKEIAFVKEIAKDTRTIEYVAFPLSSFPDSEVSAWLRTNSATFKRLTLSRITLGSEESEALKIRKQIEDKTTTFEDAAKASSKDSYAEKGGAEGTKYFHEISADLAKKEDAEKLASLAKGQLSPAFKTVSGSWVLFRADADPSDPDPSDPTVVADAKEYMLRSERGKVEDSVVAKAKSFAATAASDFAKAAKAAGLATKSAGPFPMNYGDLSVYISMYRQSVPLLALVAGAENQELASASTNEKFLMAAFSVAPGSLSEPIIVGDNVIVFKVKEAGSALDGSASGLDIFYPYFYRTKAEYEARDSFLKSPLLKDDFSKVYLKYFMPKQK